MKKCFSSVMSVDYGNSNEGSCERELSDVESLLPDKNCLIRGKNYAFAIGRRIARGRFGAVYEVSKALFFFVQMVSPQSRVQQSRWHDLYIKVFRKEAFMDFCSFILNAMMNERRENQDIKMSSYRSWCRRSKCHRILMLSWEYCYGLLLKF